MKKIAILAAMILTFPAMAAEPLSKVVNQSISDCRTQETLNVNMIAWGGDIPTLVANGNSLKTAPDSLFGDLGLKVELARKDVFAEQVEDYLACRTPFLRGTQGMINMAADLTEKDPRTKMVAIYQLSWSNGGDALVAASGIQKPIDLKGKTIAVQKYGPHVEYMATVLADAGLSISDVKIKWAKELTGGADSPAELFASGKVDAAFVIIPDALTLTSGLTVGTGAEGSRKGATMMLSTKSLNRLISDVYVVRSDYFKANREQVQDFVHGLFLAEEYTREMINAGGVESTNVFSAASKYLLGVDGDIEGAKGLWLDAETTGFRGNTRWVDKSNPRNWTALNNDAQAAFVKLGLVSSPRAIQHAAWNYELFKEGLTDVSGVEQPKFNQAALAKVIDRMDKTGALDDAAMFEFSIYFDPEQTHFQEEQYQEEFDRVIDQASKYGGAVITINGHSDVMAYLRQEKNGASRIVLKKTWLATKNLSMQRAISVQQAVIDAAKSRGITMDPSQFATIGKGITDPATGMCGSKPCAPKTEAEWRSNMRVEFKIVRVEAEESVFTPLN